MGAGASNKGKDGARKKGEIDRMCGLARSTSTRNQKKAATALEKISAMGDSYCEEMAELGVIAVTALLAESKSAIVRYKVALILFNMARVESNRPLLLEERASMTLLDLFKHKKPEGLRQALTAAVEAFASLPEARIECLPTIKPILEYLRTADLEEQIVVLSALAKMTESVECQFRALKMNVLETVFNLALSEFHTYRHKALAMRTLSHFASNPACLPYIVRFKCDRLTPPLNGPAAHILAKLCRTRDLDMLPYAVQTIEHLMSLSEDMCVDMSEWGIFKEFAWMLGAECDSAVVKLRVLQALLIMAEHTDVQRLIVEKKMLPLLLPFSSSPHEKLRQTSAQLVAKLSRHPLNRARIIYNGGHEALLFHGTFSPDPLTRSIAGPAADELLNLPGARMRKSALKVTTRLREKMQTTREQMAEMVDTSKAAVGKSIVKHMLETDEVSSDEN